MQNIFENVEFVPDGVESRHGDICEYKVERNSDDESHNSIEKDKCPECQGEDIVRFKTSYTRSPNYTVCQECGNILKRRRTG